MRSFDAKKSVCSLASLSKYPQRGDAVKELKLSYYLEQLRASPIVYSISISWSLRLSCLQQAPTQPYMTTACISFFSCESPFLVINFWSAAHSTTASGFVVSLKTGTTKYYSPCYGIPGKAPIILGNPYLANRVQMLEARCEARKSWKQGRPQTIGFRV